MYSRAAIAECCGRAAPAGSDLYYATLFLDATIRARILSLHAFANEVAGIPRSIGDPGVARLKLAWWSEEVSRLQVSAAAHPISIALRASGVLDSDNASALDALINAAASWLGRLQLPDMTAVIEAHDRFEGILWRETALLSGVSNAAALSSGQRLGCAIGIVESLRGLRDNARANIARLPTDILTTHGVPADTLLRDATPEAVTAVATHMAGHARAIMLSALQHLHGETRQGLLPIMIMTDISAKTLAEMQRVNFPLLTSRLSLTPMRKLWTAIKVRRRERRLERHR